MTEDRYVVGLYCGHCDKQGGVEWIAPSDPCGMRRIRSLSSGFERGPLDHPHEETIICSACGRHIGSYAIGSLGIS
jgi:hypothetical protein